MATVVWKGGAQAIAQVTTITFSAYTSGETYTIVINGKAVTFLATASTSANVSAGLIAAIQAAAEPEFAAMTASGTTSVILTGNTPGEPTTITGSGTSGITATITPTVAATGPNFFDDPDNWVGGAAPSGGDDLVFKDSSYSVLYELVDATVYGDITVESTFTGEIGLPVQNALGYREYRPRFLKLGDGSTPYAVTIGVGNGRQPSRVFLDLAETEVIARVYGAGSSGSDEPPIILKNFGTDSELDVYAGTVHVTADASASLAALRITPSDQSSQLSVVVDSGVSAGTVIHAGGSLEVRGSAASIDCSNNAVARFLLASQCPTIVVATGGTVYWESTAGVTTKITSQFGGVMSFARNGSPKTVAAAECFAGGAILDPLAAVTWTAGIDLLGCSIADVTIDLGRSRTVTPS